MLNVPRRTRNVTEYSVAERTEERKIYANCQQRRLLGCNNSNREQMKEELGFQIDRAYTAGKTISAKGRSRFVSPGIKAWSTSYAFIRYAADK